MDTLNTNLNRISEMDTNYYDYTTRSDVLRYVNFMTENKTANEKPYLLILYGPPASGKTTAKKFMTKQLNLSNNYVYISEDQFIYDTIQYNEMKTKVHLDSIKDYAANELEHSSEVKFLQDEYNKIRKKTKLIIRSLADISMMFKYNIVLETTGAALDWFMTHLINEFHHSNYQIQLAYPYISNLDLLHQRSIERGFKEYRFTPKEYLTKVSPLSLKNFKIIILDNHLGKFKNIYVYDAEKVDIDGGNLKDLLLYYYSEGIVVIQNDHFLLE